MCNLGISFSFPKLGTINHSLPRQLLSFIFASICTLQNVISRGNAVSVGLRFVILREFYIYCSVACWVKREVLLLICHACGRGRQAAFFSMWAAPDMKYSNLFLDIVYNFQVLSVQEHCTSLSERLPMLG